MLFPKTTVSNTQEKLREATAQAVRMKNEEIQTSGHKDDSDVDTASATDLERATAETKEVALRLQLAEKQVCGILALW